MTEARAKTGARSPVEGERIGEIRALTGLRGIAAAVVVLVHIGPILWRLVPSTRDWEYLMYSGIVAVDFFFLLSGFVITLTYLDALARPNKSETLRYLALRFARIWPVHALMVVAYVLFELRERAIDGYGLEADNVGVANTLANMAFLTGIPPFSAINPPAWSLGMEAAAYLAFPFLALALIRIRSARTAFVLAGVIVAVGTWWLWELSLSLALREDVYSVDWLRIAVCFPVGCLLAVGWRLLPRDRRSSRLWDVVIVLALGATALTAWLINREGPFDEPMLVYPFLALTVLAAAGSTGPVARFLGSPVMRWGGLISYSLYLTHHLVLIFISRRIVVWQSEGFSEPARLALLVATCAVVIGVAAAVYHLVEEPARRALHRRLAPGR